MSNHSLQSGAEAGVEGRKRGNELAAFLFVTVCVAPIVTVAIVAGYGFFIWIYQLLAGPPVS
ncbi:MAG: periplasmic nitrate reductase, NapE protein [Kiloniellales bacterium]|nr:periplasmic nitrate reductase, NapE protein [Kiloniellales bacterium]